MQKKFVQFGWADIVNFLCLSPSGPKLLWQHYKNIPNKLSSLLKSLSSVLQFWKLDNHSQFPQSIFMASCFQHCNTLLRIWFGIFYSSHIDFTQSYNTKTQNQQTFYTLLLRLINYALLTIQHMPFILLSPIFISFNFYFQNILIFQILAPL